MSNEECFPRLAAPRPLCPPGAPPPADAAPPALPPRPAPPAPPDCPDALWARRFEEDPPPPALDDLRRCPDVAWPPERPDTLLTMGEAPPMDAEGEATDAEDRPLPPAAGAFTIAMVGRVPGAMAAEAAGPSPAK